jgi:hypothetical protein
MTDYTYTTDSLIKAELRATVDFSATTIPTLVDINEWIKESSAAINATAGRTYGETSYSETFDYNGTETLVTRNAPLISVTNVLYSTSALGTDSYSLDITKTEDTDYTIYLENGEIELLPSWSPTCGKKRIQINYSAGFATTPKDVQMLATKQVTKRVLDTLLSKDVNEKKSGKSVSVGSISIVKPADFGVAQYKTLSTDIDRLEQSILEGTSVYRLPLNKY